MAGELQFGQGDFFAQTVARLSEIAGEPIPRNAFQLDKVPRHLRVNYRVVDSGGKTVTEGRDLATIRESLGVEKAVEVDRTVDNGTWTRDGITEWDFGELPQQITISRNNIELAAFPTLIDDGDSVQLRLLNSADLARRETRAGVRRLYAMKKRKALRSQVSWLPRFEEICVLAAPVISKEALTDQVRDLIADRAFFQRGERLPRDAEAFAARLEDSAERHRAGNTGRGQAAAENIRCISGSEVGARTMRCAQMGACGQRCSHSAGGFAGKEVLANHSLDVVIQLPTVFARRSPIDWSACPPEPATVTGQQPRKLPTSGSAICNAARNWQPNTARATS